MGLEFPRGMSTCPIFWSVLSAAMTESTHLDLVWGKRSFWLKAGSENSKERQANAAKNRLIGVD